VSARREIAADVVQRAAPAAVVAAKTSALFAVTRLVVFVLRAFAEPAVFAAFANPAATTVVVSPPVLLLLLEATTGAVRFIESPERFAPVAVFARVVVSFPLIIQVISVSCHCFPP